LSTKNPPSSGPTIGKRKHAAEQPLMAAALAGRNEIADHRLRNYNEPAPADPLQTAEQDELQHVLRQPT
jgi:hypothetical protein